MKILLIDIETSPNLADVWGLWQQNVGLKQLHQTSEMICFAAKFIGQDETFFSSTFHYGKKEMLSLLHNLLSESDVVVHYNGRKFDMRIINREFITNGMLPPPGYRQIDLMLECKKHFRFESNKLEYVVKALGVGEKIDTSLVGGHLLWKRCVEGDFQAWELMKEYNIHDTLLLEPLYYKLLPWISGHPNYNLYGENDVPVCPSCGSDHLIKKGFAYTAVSKFQRYICKDCGAQSRGRKNLHDRTNTIVPITL